MGDDDERVPSEDPRDGIPLKNETKAHGDREIAHDADHGPSHRGKDDD